MNNGRRNLLTVNMRCPQFTTQIDDMRLNRRTWILHNFEVKMLPIKKGYTVLAVDDKGQDWKDPCSSC